MSARAVAAVFRHSASKGAARLVLLAMADEAADTGDLCAYRRSQSWIGRKANMDARSVRRAIAALVELGEVEIANKGDGRQSSDYRIRLPELDNEGGPGVLPARTAGPPRADQASAPSSRSSPVSPVRSARATADAAAGHLPGIADPQPGDDPVDDKAARESLAWKLVREAYDARRHKPIESRKVTARTVGRLLDAGWTAEQVADALRASPAWTPTSLQVELSRRGRQPAGRVRQTDDRRKGESRVVDMSEVMNREP